ncbi:MAG TPA: methyltransferase, TIGR04325 family, partial [Chitinophagaceae bacterium]|nr:methyltransferase, TIGR04325 family [Chitinophagaceae bacterium]
KEYLKEVPEMSIKDFIKSLVVKLGLNKSMWSGDFKTWDGALQKCEGYSSLEILEKVKKAVLKVKDGEAVYERDSVLFDKIQYSWPLLSSLMWVAAKNNSSLKVMDFGGSLGSTYFQNRKFLIELHYVEWNIVEQENFVTVGRDCIGDDRLQFFYSIDECIRKKGKPDILILACTLPYIEKPYELIDELLNYKIPHILIDNTFFNYEERDRITLQKVPPSIYHASYPCWFLSYKKLKEHITGKYSIVCEYFNDSKIWLDGRSIQYRGFLVKII